MALEDFVDAARDALGVPKGGYTDFELLAWIAGDSGASASDRARAQAYLDARLAGAGSTDAPASDWGTSEGSSSWGTSEGAFIEEDMVSMDTSIPEQPPLPPAQPYASAPQASPQRSMLVGLGIGALVLVGAVLIFRKPKKGRRR
jgi:hypothetical protein